MMLIFILTNLNNRFHIRVCVSCFVAAFLTSFKLPSYDEVAAQPSTPPPPYSSVFALQGGPTEGPSSSCPHYYHPRQPCSPYLGPSPKAVTSSQSSDNYTSCSCESCSLTSPSSTSFSVQVTDETDDSSRLSTPSEVGANDIVTPRSSPPTSRVLPDLIPAVAPDVISVQRSSSEGVSIPPSPLSLSLHSHAPNPTRLPLSPLVLLSSHPSGQSPPLDLLSAASSQKAKAEGPPQNETPSPYSRAEHEMYKEGDEEDDDEEDHFRHRRLTGDSGIEVCRCHVRRAGEEQQKGLSEKRGTDGGANMTRTMKSAERSCVSDDREEQHGGAPSSSWVTYRAGEAVLTLESS